MKKRTLRILDKYIRILSDLQFLLQDKLSTKFYIACTYNQNLEVLIQLLKLVEFGKEGDKEEKHWAWEKN